MHDINWVDKVWEFELNMDEFATIVARLRHTPVAIRQLVEGKSSEHFTKRVDGAWSVHEHIGHLADLEALHEGRIDDFEAGLEVLRAADMTNRKTEEANHNERSLDELLTSFEAIREHFVNRLEGLGQEVLYRSALHPRLQKMMRPVDLAFFCAEHDDHHVAAIARLMESSSL